MIIFRGNFCEKIMKEKYYNKGKDRCVGKVKEFVEQFYFEFYNCYLE